MPHVVVIGGGITGLVAAFRLSQQAEVSVTLIDGADRVGGKIETASLEGATVELGADSFLPRDESPLRLCREVAIAGDLVQPSDFGGWVWLGAGARRLPAGTVLGFPASIRSIARAKVLSVPARLRAAAEVLHRRPLTGPDVAVGAFARRRLGRQVLDRLVDPLLSGTRAGDPGDMSLAAALPLVDAAARSHGSVIRGLAHQRRGAAGTAFYAPRGGMNRLVDALERTLPGEVRLCTRAERLHRTSAGFAVELDSGTLEADGVIVATPAYETARLVASLSPQAAWHLGQIRHASAAVVNLVFPAGSVATPGVGSGILIPSKAGMTIAGCTWFSSKWPAHAAPDGRVTIRCFVGRRGRDPALDLDDSDLAGVVVAELARLIGISDEPVGTLTTRWERGLPAYRLGHLDRVDRIEGLLGTYPGVAVAGASYRGSGIPDCIAQAEAAARRLLADLRR